MKLFLPILLLLSVCSQAQKKELKDDPKVLAWRAHIKESIINKEFQKGNARAGWLNSSDTIRIDTLVPSSGNTLQYKLSLKLIYKDSSKLGHKMVAIGDSTRHILEMNLKSNTIMDSVNWKVLSKNNRMNIVILTGVKGRKIRYFYKREEIK